MQRIHCIFILLTILSWRSIYFIIIWWLFIVFCVLRYRLYSIPSIFNIPSHIVIFMISGGIWPIKIFLLIVIFVCIRTLSLTITRFKIILIKRAIYSEILAFRATSTVYTFYAFLFWFGVVILSDKILFFFFINIGKSKDISTWI